jgi:hypothetical protein
MMTTFICSYWNGIQRMALGPRGDQVGPGAYFYRFAQIDKFTSEMGECISKALDQPMPRGIIF